MARATKIVATLGPASQLARGARADAGRRASTCAAQFLARHGRRTTSTARAPGARRAPRRLGKEVAIMADLQGPKIRVGKFAGGKVVLKPGQSFVLDAACAARRRTSASASTTRSCRATSSPGDMLLLNDGLIRLDVDAVRGDAGAHPRGGRRRPVEQQGHQQAGRRPDRAGADRQGHGRHQDRGRASSATTWRCRFPKNATDMEMARQLPTSPAAAGARRC